MKSYRRGRSHAGLTWNAEISPLTQPKHPLGAVSVLRQS